MTRPPPPSAALRLHGDIIRRLRESRGLTQLYVAEVVGVTVDTVSRWENNRTSTVKRENAQALAHALEVEVDEILRDDPPVRLLPPSALEPGEPERPAPAPRHRSRLVTVLGAALGVAAVWIWVLWPAPALRVQGGRRLPSYAAPGSVVPVIVRLRAEGAAQQRVILREHLPPGWSLVSSTTPPDSGPTGDGLIRWILPAGPTITQLAYLVRAPSGVPTGTAYRFQGEVVTPGRRGRSSPLAGEARIDLEWIHWADDNGDFQVSDAELLDALERVEAARGLGVNGAEVRALWGAGSYRWDEAARRFTPGPPP